MKTFSKLEIEGYFFNLQESLPQMLYLLGKWWKVFTETENEARMFAVTESAERHTKGPRQHREAGMKSLRTEQEQKLLGFTDYMIRHADKLFKYPASLLDTGSKKFF